MERLNEASTWAGAAGIAQGVKFLLPPPWAWVADAAAIIFGGIAAAKRG